jgi:tetratricopeptide (TPR) repeat protein
MNIFTPEEVTQLIAKAYFEAAQHDANMNAVTASLETIRTAFLNEENGFETWMLLDEHIGRADEDCFQPILIKLREEFEKTFTEKNIERLRREFQQDRSSGWTSWLKTYVAGITTNKWRLSFCLALAEASLPLPSDLEHSLEKIRYYTRCMLQERWAETYPWFMFLAHQPIPPEHQAKLLVNASEIQIYHLLNFEKAKELLDQANQAAPKEIRVLYGWGEYWLELEVSDFDKVEAIAKEINETNPLIQDGYVLLGDCYTKSDKIEAAEEQYQQAIRNIGQTEGYISLMRLYGRRELFDKRRDQVSNLKKHILAIEPTSEYTLHITEGYLYEQNNLYEDAHRCYESAICLDNTRLTGYTYNGYLYLAEKRFDEDGYWGMTWLCEQQQGWQLVLHWCELCLAHRPEWASNIYARKGNCYRQLGEYAKAEEELFRVLRLDLKNQQALDNLLNLADDYYKKNNSDEALRIYESLREMQGESYEADYQNRVGNLNYYNSKYREAAAAYQRAISATPQEAVYHSNLALALENFKTTGERCNELKQAITALQEAYRLNAADDDARRLEILRQELKLVTLYGEAIATLLPVAKPIRVYTETSVLSYILDEESKELSVETFHLIDEMRSQIKDRFGVKIPSILFGEYQDSSKPGLYYFSLMEARILSGSVVLGRKFFPGHLTDLSNLQIAADPGFNPLTEEQGYWINQIDWEAVEYSGQKLWTVAKYLLEALKVLLQSNLSLFVIQQEVWNLLNICTTDACAEIKKSAEKLTALTQVLKALILEKTPIIAFESICNEFLMQYQPDANLTAIVEQLRLLPEIRGQLLGNNTSFTFYQLGESLEERLQGCILPASHQFVLAIEPEFCQDVRSAIRNRVSGMRDVALLVNISRLRPLLRKLTELEFPHLPILCRSELLDGLENQVEHPSIE